MRGDASLPEQRNLHSKRAATRLLHGANVMRAFKSGGAFSAGLAFIPAHPGVAFMTAVSSLSQTPPRLWDKRRCTYKFLPLRHNLPRFRCTLEILSPFVHREGREMQKISVVRNFPELLAAHPVETTEQVLPLLNVSITLIVAPDLKHQGQVGS